MFWRMDKLDQILQVVGENQKKSTDLNIRFDEFASSARDMEYIFSEINKHLDNILENLDRITPISDVLNKINSMITLALESRLKM